MAPIKPDFELIIMYPTFDFKSVLKNSAIITMYEANKCPSYWVKRLNGLKLPIFAPSKFVKAMFTLSGVKVPIEHLPLGIDTDFYASSLRSSPSKRPFRFLTVGKMEPRKNLESTVRCFSYAFAWDKDVELVIKTREKFLHSSIKRAASMDKRIKIIEKTITEEELLKLYYYCDSFIYPSRGEGFAFPPRNAVATGMPTIVTDWSALEEIPGAIKIPIKSLSPMPPCGFSYGEEKDLLMADINEVELVNEMKRLVYDTDYYNEQAKLTHDTKQDSWEDCANNFIELVNK